MKARRYIRLALTMGLSLSCAIAQAKKPKYALLAPPPGWVQANPYEFGAAQGTRPAQVIAFGDIHGNLDAVLRILIDRKIIDRDLNWIAGNVMVVNPGDVLDGKPDARLIYDLFLTLEAKAKKAGSIFRFTLGNHEILGLTGNDKHMKDAERLLFEDADQSAEEFESDAGLRALLLDPNEPYADWLVQRDILSVFRRPPRIAGEPDRRVAVLHAGINAKWLPKDMKTWPKDPLAAINYTGRVWTKYLLDYGRAKAKRAAAAKAGQDPYAIPLPEHPPYETGWVVGINSDGKLDQTLGPMFDRDNKIEFDALPEHSGYTALPDKVKGAVSKKDSIAALESLGLYGYIMGHAPNKNGSIEQSPRLGDRAIVIDSHMAFGGKTTALVYDNSVDAAGKTPYFQMEIPSRPDLDADVLAAKTNLERLPAPHALHANACRMLLKP